MSAPTFSVSVQKAVIGISINSTVLSALLLGTRNVVFSTSLSSNVDPTLPGIYSVVYIGALYIYCKSVPADFNDTPGTLASNRHPIVSKKSSQHWVVLAAISSSYAAYVTYSIIVWFFDQQLFVNDSDTRETLFLAVVSGPNWIVLVNDILIFLIAAIADGILVSKFIRAHPFITT